MKKIDFHEKKESFVYTYIIIFHHSYVDRHACMYPLQLTKLLGQVDVECLGKMHKQCRFTVTISFLKCPQSMLDTLYYYLPDYILLNYLSISLFFSWFWRIYWTSWIHSVCNGNGSKIICWSRNCWRNEIPWIAHPKY